MEYFYLEHVKSKNVMVRPRTNTHQPFMFLNGCYIIKGPYNDKSYNTIIERSKILKMFKIANVIHPMSHFVTPQGIFIRYINFLADYKIETKFHTELFSRNSYTIVKNSHIMTMREILDSKTNTWIFSSIKSLIKTLCYFYILDISDTNIDNIYIDLETKQIHVIDYDNSTNEERDDEIFYFNKKPDNSYNWYNNCNYCYDCVANDIDDLLNDKNKIPDNLQERARKTVNLLRKFAFNPKISYLKISTNLNNKSVNINSPYENISDPNIIYLHKSDEYLRLTNYLQKYSYLFENIDGRFMCVQQAYQYYKFNYIGANTDTLAYKDIILNNYKFCEFIGKQKEVPEISEVVNTKILTTNMKISTNNIKVPRSPYLNYLRTPKPSGDLENCNKKENIRVPRIPTTPIKTPYKKEPSKEAGDQKFSGNILNHDDKGNLVINEYKDYYLGYNLISKKMDEKNKLDRQKHEINQIIRIYKEKAVINPKWNNIKIRVMKYILYKKFNDNESDRNILLSTDDKILYFDKIPYNTFWGIDDKGDGDNILGKLLMELRSLFKEKYPMSEINIENYNIISDNLQMLKSNLRKYIQRGATNKSLLLGSILYNSQIDINDICNFIYDIAINDIGPANDFLISIIIKVCSESPLERNSFLNIIKLLSESDKSRLSCHAWYAYCNNHGRQVSIINGLNTNLKLSTGDVNFIKYNHNLFNESFDVTDLLLIFCNRLINKDLSAFSLCYLYLEETKKSRSDSIKLLWRILSKFIESEIFKLLEISYYNSKENMLFLQQAIIMAIYHDNPIKKYKFGDTHAQQFKVEYDFKLDNMIDDNLILIPENMIYYDELLHKIYDYKL